MLVGVLSNTMGRALATSAAAELLLSHGAELILHCGDVGGRQVLDALSKYDAACVWGDRDTDRMGLLRHANNLQLTCYGMLASLELGGKQVCLYHGDDSKLTRRILQEQQFDYLLTGHSLQQEDSKTGKTRVICPGSFQDAAQTSVALLDLATDEVSFLIPAFT